MIQEVCFMLKITFSKPSEKEPQLYDASPLVIGSAFFQEAHINLFDQTLEAEHVIICEKQGKFEIVNQANDPFVTLNGVPFGKKILKGVDTLQIGGIELLIETTSDIHSSAGITDQELDLALDQKLQGKSIEAALSRAGYPESPLMMPLAEGEEIDLPDLSSEELDALLRQVEEMGLQEETQPSPAQSVRPPEEKGKIHSLKDSYLSDYDDRIEKKKETEKGIPKLSLPQWNWDLIRSISAVMLLVLIFLGGLVYLNVSARNKLEEYKGAGGVADIAMALTYAQMHHIKPPNQNWSDPEFLKSNLLAVLAEEYAPAFSFDNHGQFANNNYFIRIYTSNDLSQFIVLAQPTPSLKQWLIPKATIIVDSNQMELRKINDLKALNRLFLNPTSLEGSNASEASALIKNGELISLPLLALQSQKNGFHPPKALGMIREGAENRIYNAPRYYQFGEVFMNNAITLAENPSDSHEVELLQMEMKALAKHTNIVLYSPWGMQWAIDAQKALNIFVPTNPFLVAYLKFDTRGLVTSGHLLMDQGPGELAMAPKVIAHLPLPEKSKEGKGGENHVENNHPLYLQLTSIKTLLEKPLPSLEKEITSLLENSNRKEIVDLLKKMQTVLQKGIKRYSDQPEMLAKQQHTYQFIAQLETLLRSFDQEIERRNHEAVQQLKNLYEEYSAMPLARFIDYLKAAGLEHFVEETLHLYEAKQTNDVELPTAEIEEATRKIQAATTLAELKDQVNEIANLLKLAKVPDPKKLIAYQSETRQRVVEKLNDFLLSATKSLPSAEFKEQNKAVLAHILKTAWVVDPDEFEFYIHEFELRAANNP